MFQIIINGKVILKDLSFDCAMNWCFDNGYDPDKFIYYQRGKR